MRKSVVGRKKWKSLFGHNVIVANFLCLLQLVALQYDLPLPSYESYKFIDSEVKTLRKHPFSIFRFFPFPINVT